MKEKDNPIDNITWLHYSQLNANDYNPNMVMTPEMRLLERSILMTGWVQPVLINKDYMVIDGFHRWTLTKESKLLNERYHGRLPCAVLNIDRAQAMLITIRMNRAKGSHAAFRMSEIIKELIDVHHVDTAQIALDIGANKDEIDLLYQDSVFTQRDIKNYKYSKAWYPIDDKKV